MQSRQGYQVACLEEIAYSRGWITREAVLEQGRKMQKNTYGRYLLMIAEDQQ